MVVDDTQIKIGRPQYHPCFCDLKVSVCEPKVDRDPPVENQCSRELFKNIFVKAILN
jgi:hypothetical protein